MAGAGVPAAVVVGRGIRIAERRSPRAARPSTTAALTPPTTRAPAAARVRRRAVPLPPLGVGLAAVAVGIVGTGFALRLSGSTGPAARALSMDAPMSVPRLFVAALFALAAVAAVAGSTRNPGRRTWWLAVGFVAGGIAVVKAGGTVHTDGVAAVVAAVGEPAAVAISAAADVAVMGILFLVSRTERRDRRRVLGSLTGYGVATVGLSALSETVPSSFVAAATFVEEAGEALAGVALLMAVLVGVAPRLVLPADWALRRTADAASFEVPEVLPGPAARGTARG